MLSGDISLPSVSSSHPHETVSSSVHLVEQEVDPSLSEQKANTFELLSASSAVSFFFDYVGVESTFCIITMRISYHEY